MMNSRDEQEDGTQDEESVDTNLQTRRGLLSKIGAVAFGFTAIGFFGGDPAWPQPPQESGPALGPGLGCRAGTRDTHSPDESCGVGPPHDIDEACQKAATTFPTSTLHDTDNACELIAASDPADSSQDKDQSCGSSGGSPDEACGDCNDNHDTDNNCGASLGASAVDSDELCGHSSFFNPAGFNNEDRACVAPDDEDAGCGVQSSTYANDWTDTDSTCNKEMTNGETNPDQNCAASSVDETCGMNAPPFGSSPDEGCVNGGASIDQGCASPTSDPSYDRDNACNSTGDQDQSCGSGAGWSGLGGPGIENNVDESCSSSSIDEACGATPVNSPDPVDPDDAV